MNPFELPLVTKRLQLRNFQSSDLEAVHAYASNARVVEHQAWGPNTLDQTREFVEQCAAEATQAQRRSFNLAVVLNDGRLAGGCMAAVSADGREAEIGYSFEPSYWGQGFASEAVAAMVAQLFIQAGVQRIFATCGPSNTASIRLLQRAGFVLEGRLRADKVVRGQVRNSLLWGRLRDDAAAAPGLRGLADELEHALSRDIPNLARLVCMCSAAVGLPEERFEAQLTTILTGEVMALPAATWIHAIGVTEATRRLREWAEAIESAPKVD